MKLKNGYDFEFQIETDVHCLLNCKHCSSLELRSQKITPVFHNEITDICKHLNKYKILINFTGGEPLCELNFLNYVTSLHKLSNVFFGLFSSGIQGGFDSISFKCIEELRKYKFKVVHISLYSDKEPVHDLMVGKKGAYLKTKESIYRLARCGLYVVVHLVLNKLIADRVYDVINTLIALPIGEIRILRLVKTGNAINNWEEIGINNDIEDIIAKKIAQHGGFGRKIFLSGRPDIFPCRQTYGAQGCQAGSRLVYIDYLGNVWPCASMKGYKEYLIGHVSKTEKIVRFINNNFNKHHKKCIGFKI